MLKKVARSIGEGGIPITGFTCTLAIWVCPFRRTGRFTWFTSHRFTSQGDTVMTVNADRDTCVECALALGRRIEAFVADDQTRGDVVARVEAAFEGPYREGYFGVSLVAT